MTPKVSFIVALNKTQDQQSPHMHALNAYAKANDGDILVGRDLLYAATGDVVILIEDILCDLGPMFKAYENFTNDEDVILGVAQQRRRHIFFDQWVNTILAKDLCYDPCIFRIIPQEKLGKLLGRIYLKDRGFNLEWAYVSHKLNYKTSLITIDVKDRLQLKPSLKLFWDIIKLRMWHFPMINRHDQHMSDKDVSDMYAHESNHWWFVAKANFMKKILCIWLQHHPHSILDAGCGTGHNMRFLAEKGCYVGLDVSAQALINKNFL